MKKIIDIEGFSVEQVEESDINQWIKEEFKQTHPETLIKKTFPEHIMKIIRLDHHKSKDGSFSISYDYWNKKWFFAHEGYIRDVFVEGESYLDCANKYLMKIKRENDKQLYKKIEDQANNFLPKNYYVEIADDSITLKKYENGFDHVKTIVFKDCKDKSLKEIIDMVEELLKEHEPEI